MKSLLAGDFTTEIESCVSKYIGKPWTVQKITPNIVGAMHEAARFEGSQISVYVKLGARAFSAEQFEIEADGLRYIREKSDVRSPRVLGVVHTEKGTLLVMEAIHTRRPENRREWELLGEGLASLHKTCHTHCGFETATYLGTFKQDNTYRDTWEEFYAQVRLRDSLNRAIESGRLENLHIAAVERLIDKIPSLCGPAKPFSLLHGDPWLENLLFDGEQLVVIDCSLYYGHHEMDLAVVELFCPVDPAFFDGYHYINPIDSGYLERKDLWRVNQWINQVTLGGQDQIPQLMEAVYKYL